MRSLCIFTLLSYRTTTEKVNVSVEPGMIAFVQGLPTQGSLPHKIPFMEMFYHNKENEQRVLLTTSVLYGGEQNWPRVSTDTF